MLSDPRIRRLLTGCLVLIVAIFAAKQLYGYLTTGKLTVQTNNKDSRIRILDQDNREVKGLDKQGDKLSERLKPGRYIVSAYAGPAYANKTVNINAKQQTALTFKLSPPQTPEPVFSEAVLSMSVSDDSLYFVGPATGDIAKIDAQGSESVISDAYVFKRIRWMSPGTGVAMDDSHNLYTVGPGGVNPLQLPFPINNNPSIDFDIASNGALYVSNGQDVYAGTMSGNFVKVYSSGSNYNSSLAAGVSGVAFVEKNAADGSTSIVTVRGGEHKKIAAAASQLAWSPDGKYLAAGGGKGMANIYDGALRTAYAIPNQGIAQPIWPNETSLVYSVGNIVWSYSLTSQESKSIAALPANQSIGGAAVSNNKDYLYFSGNAQLLRIGLGGRTADSSMAALGAFLPGTEGICSLNYVNFVNPIITIQYPPLEGDFDRCVKAAKGQLRYYGLNPGKFRYVKTEPSDVAVPRD